MSNLLLKLIKIGIGLILFIPLYVGGSFFFPFIFPKIWLFQLITEIIFFLYFILALYDVRFRPKLNLATYALTALTIILIITSFTGVDIFRSFWGNTERMSGVIAWLHFVAFAIILSGIFKTEKEWRNFFAIAASVSIIEFFYVLAQTLGASFVWIPGSQDGTIGNTDLLGTYAIFSAFFALYLWNRSGSMQIEADQHGNYQRQSVKNPRESASNFKWLWAAAFFLNIGTLYLAASRGAILGFACGVGLYIIFVIWHRPAILKTALSIIAGLILIYGLLWSMRNTDFVKNNYQLNRVINVSLQSDTVQQRLTEWGIAWNAFLARPIFGWGPNNYLYLHNAFLNPRVYNLRETNFDRAHNAYLDYASMSGILGLLGYIFVIGVLFWVFFKSKMWVWVSLITAYAIQSFFVFDSPASYIVLFLTVGFAIFVENSKSETLNPKQIQNSRLKPQTAMAISILYFLFSIFLIYQVSILPTQANLSFVQAFSGLSSGAVTPEQAFQDYKDSVSHETLGTTEFRNQFTQWFQANINRFPAEERLAVVDFGISELGKEAKEHPSVFTYLNLGQTYYFKGNGISDPAIKSESYSRAAAAYDKALELAPKRLEVYYSYLQMDLTTKNYNHGVEIMKRAAAEAPNYPKNWWYLGIANVAAGKEEDAILNINKSLIMYYAPYVSAANNGLDLSYNISKILIGPTTAMPPGQEILGVVNPYIKEKKYKELLLLYVGAEMQDPKNIGFHQSLALVYQNLGLHDKALEELKIIDELSKQK